ncbi:inactive dipeptidyl peptidase 10-like [Stigmatopora nigra]
MNQSAGAAQHSRRYSSDDNIATAPIVPDRNWKGICISVFVILVVFSLIGMSIHLLSKDDRRKCLGSPLSLDDILQKDFRIRDPDAKWISEKEIVFINKDGDLLNINTESNKTELLMKNTTFSTFKASKFAVSPDLNFILLAYDVKQVYQHSFMASYLIYNLYTREVLELNPPEVSNSVLQFASWGVGGQQLIYIFENNIYYQANVQTSSWRLTSSGEDGVIFNGIADWLYEEEVLHTQAAHWWSPDGTKLAYLTLNDSLVPKMLLPCYMGSAYPRGKEYPYPKMGQINPTVSLYVVMLDGSSQTTELLPPHSLAKSEYYITMVKWVAVDKLAVRWLNRAQNISILLLCDTHTYECTKRHVMMSDKWLDRQTEDPMFSKDCTIFFMTLPTEYNELGAFHHVTMISNKGEDEKLIPLTSGSWEVSQILGYDEKNKFVYFLSKETGKTQQHLYRVLAVQPFHKQCLTCSLFKSQCTFYDAVLSTNYQYLLLQCRGPGIPQTTLHRLVEMKDYVTLERNTVLQQALINRKIPKREKRTVQINNVARCMELIFPNDFDETYKYPVLLVLGSTPGDEIVSDHFSLGWDSVLVSSENVIVARLDVRGSSFQGQGFLHGLHQQLGTVDVADQVALIEHLLNLPYIDGDKVAVYGKAYGGFLASILILSHSSTFRCSIAVAPIANWRLHGSALTEKYFGYPPKEDCKYQVSSLSSDITEHGPLKFLIIHGTADASVHFQHTAELIKFLSASNYNYTLQIFPDEGHDIASTKSERYMLNSVINFFRDCFENEKVVDQQKAKDKA